MLRVECLYIIFSQYQAYGQLQFIEDPIFKFFKSNGPKSEKKSLMINIYFNLSFFSNNIL